MTQPASKRLLTEATAASTYVTPAQVAATYEPKVNRAGSAVNQLPVLQADGTFALQGLSTLIDNTPVTAGDFGLVSPASVIASSNSGQSIGNAAYPVYLDLTAIGANDDATLFTVDTVGDKITVTAGGLYLVTWGVGFTPATGVTQETYLTKNAGNALAVASAGNTGQAAGSYPLRLSAGDYIQLIVYVEGATGTVSTQAFRNWLGMTRIGL